MSDVQWLDFKMTSNTNPSPYVVSASSEYSVNYQAWKAFNGVYTGVTDSWISKDGALTGWIQIDFGEKKTINKIKISTRLSEYATAPIGFDVLGSNNNVDFENLFTIDSLKWIVSETKEFDLKNKTAYRYYRVNVTKIESKDFIAIGKIYFGELIPVKTAIIKNPTINQHYSLADKTLILLPNGSDETMIKHGIETGNEINMSIPFDKIKAVNVDGSFEEQAVSPFNVYDYLGETFEVLSFNESTDSIKVSTKTEPFSVYNYISENPQVLIYTESTDDVELTVTTEPYSVYDHISETPELVIYNESEDDLIASTTVEQFSVYDHISENPKVVVYTESTDDIKVSTTTEPYDLYDEFGDEVEVLYYTDDDSVKEADLILEANWSPIDELDGDFEVVTWTDEPQETAQRVLEMSAIPKPQFVKLVNPKRLYGYLEDVVANDISQSYRDEARYFVSDDTTNWCVWDNKTSAFVKKDASTDKLILQNGMKFNELNAITDAQWKTWGKEYLNIGIFLKDNPRDTIVSVVDSVSYKDFLPRHSTKLSDSSLYILNTTAKIDISLEGNTIKGVLSDADLTRVQYRVILNGQPYFPTDGTFTKLGQSPQNISIILDNNSVLIDKNNILKVEFQDFFGTVDYWQTSFIGTYSGLLFKDLNGEYYSDNVGKILQFLDFGIIIAGSTTVEHEVILKNQYGYDVKNVHLFANTSEFPQGMSIQFSDSLAPFNPQPELKLSRTLGNQEEIPFYVRLSTELGATPNANGSFDIIVRADKA